MKDLVKGRETLLGVHHDSRKGWPCQVSGAPYSDNDSLSSATSPNECRYPPKALQLHHRSQGDFYHACVHVCSLGGASEEPDIPTATSYELSFRDSISRTGFVPSSFCVLHFPPTPCAFTFLGSVVLSSYPVNPRPQCSCIPRALQVFRISCFLHFT